MSTSEIIYFGLKATYSAVALVAQIAICVYHGRMYYQDLFTEERKSVAHRATPPRITMGYKVVSFWTMVQVYATLGCVISLASGFIISFQGTVISPRACSIGSVVGFTVYMIVKLSMYFVYELRLYLVYKNSKYEVKTIYLKILAAFTFCFLLFINVMYVYYFGWYENHDDVTIETYKDGLVQNCRIDGPLWLYSLFSMFDLFSTILYCYLFIKPIRGVIANVATDGLTFDGDASKESRMMRRMLKVGYKVAILTTTQFLTSIITVLLLFGLAGGIAIDVYPLDLVINTICIATMTPYYPDRIFYQRLCACCICCCDRKGYSIDEFDAQIVDKTATSSSHSKQTSTISDDTVLFEGSSPQSSSQAN